MTYAVRPFVSVLLAAASLSPILPAQDPISVEDLLRAPPAPAPEGAPPSIVTIDRAELARHAFYLASDEVGGRHTGTEGQELTARYVANTFAALGLEPLGDEVDGGKRRFLQGYDVARTFAVPDKTWIQIGDETFYEGFGVQPGTDRNEVSIDGKLVFCGRGRRSQLPESFAENEIPVIVLGGRVRDTSREMPSEMQFMMGFRSIGRAASAANNAIKRGAETVLVLDWQNKLSDVMQYAGVLPGKPDLRYGNDLGMSGMLANARARVPFVIVGRPMAEAIVEKLGCSIDEEGKLAEDSAPASQEVAAKASVTIRKEGRFTCYNVAAVLRGSDPELANEAIVFSAHMDHMGTRLDGDVFNGADDNASGTSALLEVAEAFALGTKPRRSVIFLSVSGEELGLWGSAHYANNPTWPVDDLVANINIDMIGRATPLSGVNEISVTPSYRHPKFSSIARDSASIAESMGMSFTIGDVYYERSDHINFANKGIPVIFYCDGEHPDYHQVTDTPDKLNYEKMETVARLAYWTGWNIAHSDERPVELGRKSDWLPDTAETEQR